jgi:ADP-ribose pyrophosphatase YjhB (NUDIX family)
MGVKFLSGRERSVCPNCGWIYYQRLNVGVGAFVVKDGALLLVRRALSPWQGYWNLPAGYVEVDEDPSKAVERDFLEETGLRVTVTGLFEAFFFDDDPRGNGLLLVYDCLVAGGALQITDESTEGCYFSPCEIPGDLAGGSDAPAILAWQRRIAAK